MRARTIAGAVAGLALIGAGLAVASQNGGAVPRTAASISLLAAAGNPATADAAAAAYVRARHPGAETTRVLATEPDTDRGIAVYDVRILAPDKVVYVVHVRRSNDTVLWVNRAENQTSAGVYGSPESRDAPDQSGTSSMRSPDGQDQPDNLQREPCRRVSTPTRPAAAGTLAWHAMPATGETPP